MRSSMTVTLIPLFLTLLLGAGNIGFSQEGDSLSESYGLVWIGERRYSNRWQLYIELASPKGERLYFVQERPTVGEGDVAWYLGVPYPMHPSQVDDKFIVSEAQLEMLLSVLKDELIHRFSNTDDLDGIDPSKYEHAAFEYSKIVGRTPRDIEIFRILWGMFKQVAEEEPEVEILPPEEIEVDALPPEDEPEP